jgi:aminoglycoside phosphotransferase family enzyme/predicted kinase
MAPDVYLGVADVIGPDGAPCDHVVVMRRMPDERRLSVLVRAGIAGDAEIRAIARAVAAFHTRAHVTPDIAAAGLPDTVRDKLERDLKEMRDFANDLVDADVLDEVGSLARTYLAGRAPLLERRAEQGLVRDGHGDLLADDIFCLDDGPRILDCIEFDDRLRYGDVLADLAFLVMDLERLGSRRLAAQLLRWYVELTDEHHPASLAHYYVAARALVRVKVSCIRARQGDGSARADAPALLELARRHLRRGQVHLVLVGGPPGTGKSTLASGLADLCAWVLLRSDMLRRDVTGRDYETPAEAAVGEGIYDRATMSATYAALLARAREALVSGESVVLDASWSSASRRSEAARVAQETSSRLVEIRCDAPPDVADRRIEQRRARGADISDATTDVARSMRNTFDPWPTAHIISTAVAAERALDATVALLGLPDTTSAQ